MPRTLLAVLFALTALTACSEDDPPPACPEGEEGEGVPTGAMCNGSTLTYLGGFGEQFINDYCIRCHSSEVEGDARHCAPSDHNFDTLDEIMLNREHIDEWAAAGPNGMNEGMPPNGAKPTEAERLNLGIWLACEEERLP